jgi:hypothetical protein
MMMLFSLKLIKNKNHIAKINHSILCFSKSYLRSLFEEKRFFLVVLSSSSSSITIEY